MPFPAPVYLDFKLAWLIERTGITNPSPFRRLNAIENTITGLAHRWRDRLRPLDVDAEIRMREGSRVAMCAWVEEEEVASGETSVRLAAYSVAAVRDEAAADGWVRALIAVA